MRRVQSSKMVYSFYPDLTSSDKKMLETIRTATGPSRFRRSGWGAHGADPSRKDQRVGKIAQGQSGDQTPDLGQGLTHRTNQGLQSVHGHLVGKKQPPKQTLDKVPTQGQRDDARRGRPQGRVRGVQRQQGNSRGQPPAETKTRKRPQIKDEPEEELCTVMAASEMVTGN